MQADGDSIRMITRRGFLTTLGGVAAAPLLLEGGRLLAADSPDGSSSAPAAGQEEDNRSRVVMVRTEQLLNPKGLHEDLLSDLLSILLRRMTGADKTADAWRMFLKPDDRIAIKACQTGAIALGTADPLLRAIVDSLVSAGFSKSQLLAVDFPRPLARELEVEEPQWGWTEDEYDFGSGKDRLVSWLHDATAIINVPFLLTDNIGGLQVALKNISHSVVKHPAAFFENDASPYVGDIVALPIIRDKLRVHIVNAIRVVFDGGPEVVEDKVWEAGMLLGSTDPVALDSVSLYELNVLRAKLGLKPIGKQAGTATYLPYLRAAARDGLGENRLYKIDLQRYRL